MAGTMKSTRTSKHQIKYVYNGKIGTVKELAEMFDLSLNTIRARAKAVPARMEHKTDSFVNIIRENIRVEIQKQGTSARAISLDLGRNEQYVSYFLSGKSNIPLPNLEELLSSLGLSKDNMYLMFKPPEKYTEK